MKKTILLIVYSLLLLCPYAYGQMSDVKDAIMDKEKSMWEAVKNGKMEDFKANLDPSYMGIYNSGISNFDKEMEDIGNVKLMSYNLMDVNVMQPTDDVAIITYTVDANGSYKDKPFKGKYYASSTWILKNGQWMGVLHTESMAMPEETMDMNADQ